MIENWKGLNELKLIGNLNGRWTQCHDCVIGVRDIDILGLLISDLQWILFLMLGHHK